MKLNEECSYPPYVLGKNFSGCWNPFSRRPALGSTPPSWTGFSTRRAHRLRCSAAAEAKTAICVC